MQMVVIDRSNFPDGANKLLDALVELDARGDRWVDRADMAKQLSKSTLNAGDMAYLDMLVAIGLMEHRQADSTTPTGWKWVYRLSGNEVS